MSVEIEGTGLPGLVIIHQKASEDARGYFREIYRSDTFADAGVDITIKQINKSGSVKHVTRGLHFQYEKPMAKMMRVVSGQAFLAAVDIRKNSPTLGKWYGRLFDAKDRSQLFGQPGFARGFCVLSDFAEIEYLCTATYNPSTESGIRWNDPEVGVQWPVTGEPILSPKDANAQSLREWLQRPESDLFRL